jgi:hypothetical protein
MRKVTGLGVWLAIVLSGAAGAATLDSAAVDTRAAQWQPTTREQAWEQIGWEKGLLPALATAKKTNRPVFLFTHDGRLEVGRC